MTEKMKYYFNLIIFNIKNILCKLKIKNKCKKIDEYKKIKKNKLKILNKKIEKKRNKYNLQLNLKIKKKNYVNIFIILIISILLIILFIEKSSYFKIKNINIISIDGISNTYILEKKINYIKNKLILSIDKEEIKNIILNSEQNINKIEINKKYPDTINIKVYSSQILYKTNLKGKNYLITKNGVLIPSKSNKTKELLLNIKNINLQTYPDYKKIFDKKILLTISYLEHQLEKNITNLQIERIIYFKKEKELHFIINNNTRLIFDLYGDLKAKIKQLFVFNKEKKDITKPGLIYIDNRIKGKLLYCPIENIEKCIRNINFIYNENLKTSDYKIKTIKK